MKVRFRTKRLADSQTVCEKERDREKEREREILTSKLNLSLKNKTKLICIQTN